MIVDPRDAIGAVAGYLEAELKVKFIWNKTITTVEPGKVWINKTKIESDVVCICSGADFETLYGCEFDKLNITKCKLQMMRFKAPSANWEIGTSLCGGLSLIHYESFKAAPSLQKLKELYHFQMPEYLNEGIHAMVSQNDKGELTVGDSHQYGLTFDPFDKTYINVLITDYLNRFAITDGWQLIETWNGIYPKMLDGKTDVFLQADKDVYIINGLGGAGMTLSFGFAEEVMTTI